MTVDEQAAYQLLGPLSQPAPLPVLAARLRCGADAAAAHLAIHPGSAALTVAAGVLAALLAITSQESPADRLCAAAADTYLTPATYQRTVGFRKDGGCRWT